MNRSIYVISSAPGPIKIGIANKPRKRLGQLRTGSAVPLSLAFIGECELDAAAKIEERAHKILDQSRASGEWFSVSIDVAVEAVMQAAADLGYEITPQPTTWQHSDSGVHRRVLSMRVNEEFLALVDEWRKTQPGVMPSRTEAIRRMVEIAALAARRAKEKSA